MKISYHGQKGDKLRVSINDGNILFLTVDELYTLAAIDEKQNQEELDWQSLRNQAAIAAMQGTITILSSSDRHAFRNIVAESFRGNKKTYPNEIAEFAVACAESLIEELKKERL